MLEVCTEADFQKKLLWLNGSLPAVFLVMDFWQGKLGANPPEAIIRTTGVVAIIFLALTLAVTPIAKMAKQTWLIRHRRWLGLFCFYYALLHLLSYSVFDKGMHFAFIVTDIGKRPFILLGFLGFLLSLPLAITSSNTMIKKIGALRWKKLHKLTYFIPPAVVAHYWLIVKSDIFYPAVFAVYFFLTLSWRLRKTQTSVDAKQNIN